MQRCDACSVSGAPFAFNVCLFEKALLECTQKCPSVFLRLDRGNVAVGQEQTGVKCSWLHGICVQWLLSDCRKGKSGWQFC